MNHHPKKSLGQNFLKSPSIISKIIDSADPVANDIILEIGPGLGALTERLLVFAGKVIAVEKDDLLFQELQVTFAPFIDQKKLDLINDDILEFDPEILRFYDDQKNNSYKLVANIPYNITGAIIEKFLSCSFQPEMMVVMVQKEVAERIIAKNKKTGGPGKESILSLAVKVYGIPEYVCTVKAGNFTPIPGVDSAVIKIDSISRNNFINENHEKIFFQLVKTGFAHKRKTLSGNLKKMVKQSVLETAFAATHLSQNTRAEDVGITQWITLSKIVYNNHYGLPENPVVV